MAHFPARTDPALAVEVDGGARHLQPFRRFLDFGAEPSTSTPEALNGLVRTEIAKWSKVIKAANIKPE